MSIKESDYKLALKAPIFSISKFNLSSNSEEDQNKYPCVLICCGGGSSKTGVPNSIIIANIIRNEEGRLDCKQLLNYPSDSLFHNAVCSSNGSYIFASKNDTCTIFCVHTIQSQIMQLEELLTFRSCINESKKVIQTCVVCNENGSLLAMGSDDGSVYIRNFSINEKVDAQKTIQEPCIRLCSSCHPHKQTVTSLSFHPSYEYLASTSSDGTSALINTETGAIVQKITLPSLFPPKSKISSSLFVSYLTLLLLAVTPKGKSYILSYSPYSRQHEINWKLNYYKCISNVDSSSMCISDDHQYISIGDLDGAITIFNYDETITNPRKQFIPLTKPHKSHDLPVTSLTSLSTYDSLLLPYVNKNEYKGYICSCSADFTISLLPIQNNKSSVKYYFTLFLLLLCLFSFFYMIYTKNQDFFISIVTYVNTVLSRFSTLYNTEL